MQHNRCPECGGRLSSNYCDICMRKVPFAGPSPKRYRDPWDYSSAHREEAGHKCITFDAPQADRPKQSFTKSKTTFTKQVPTFPKKKSTGKADPKKATVVAVVLALLSLLPTVFGVIEDLHVDNPTPDYNVEAFAPDAELPVVQPIGIYSNGEISIVADSLGMYYDEPSLSFLIDNFTDSDICVDVQTVAVNGIMLDVGMCSYLQAGESCQAFMTLSQQELERYEIRKIERIEMSVLIFDEDTGEEIGYVDSVIVETDAMDT